MTHELVDVGVAGALVLMILREVFSFMKSKKGNNPGHLHEILEALKRLENRFDRIEDKLSSNFSKVLDRLSK